MSGMLTLAGVFGEPAVTGTNTAVTCGIDLGIERLLETPLGRFRTDGKNPR